MILKRFSSWKNNRTTSIDSSRTARSSSSESKPQPRDGVWKTLFPWLQKKSDREQPPEPDKKKENTLLSRLTEFGQKSLPIAIVTVSGSVIVALIGNPDKFQLWLTFFFPKPVSFSCEGIAIQIPHDWQPLGCKPVALGPDADATIIPKSFVNKESDSPQILLIVDDPYENNIDLQAFYTREKEQAILFIYGKKQTDFREGELRFKGHSAYELIYDADNIKRRDIGFLYHGKQYKISYEAKIQDFDKYEKKAREIIDSLQFDPVKEAK